MSGGDGSPLVILWELDGDLCNMLEVDLKVGLP